MPRYVAFLRGVSPMNCSMPELKGCFESAGFGNVRTLLSSGNVAFDARSSSPAAIERRAVAAMEEGMGRSFGTFLRSTRHLQELIASDPFAAFKLPANAKRVVTFLHTSETAQVKLPIKQHDASILTVVGSEVLCAYVPGDKGPIFMALLERTFGKDITTRTLDTVMKCAKA